jgi:hypothetical protein
MMPKQNFLPARYHNKDTMGYSGNCIFNEFTADIYNPPDNCEATSSPSLVSLTAKNEKSEINATSPFLSSHAIAPPKFKLKYSSTSETYFNLRVPGVLNPLIHPYENTHYCANLETRF